MLVLIILLGVQIITNCHCMEKILLIFVTCHIILNQKGQFEDKHDQKQRKKDSFMFYL